jgi:NADPH-dependent ferric siderophore reductase
VKKRQVKVYRAEDGAQGVFGGQSASATPPAQRKPIDTFTMAEDADAKARELALDFVQKRHGERPTLANVCTDGSISITLRPPRS